MTTATPAVPGPIERPSTSVGGRPLVLGGIAILLAAVLGADEGGRRVGTPAPDDLRMAIPVPPGVQMIARGLDPAQGRSISVLDLDPTTPPTWNDVVVIVRRRALPGVMVGYATEPVEVPPPSSTIDDWRAFAAGNIVRVDPHPDLRSAMAAVVGRVP